MPEIEFLITERSQITLINGYIGWCEKESAPQVLSRPALPSILLPARRREQLRRCVELIAKRRRIISIVYGRLWRLNWKLEGEALFDGEIEVDESYFGGNRKGRRGRGPRGKHQYLAYLGVAERFTRRSFPMRRRQLCSRSWRTRLCLAASSIAMVDEATTCLMCRTSIASGSTIRNYLPTSKTTSAGLRISGARRSAICANSTVFQGLISGYFKGMRVAV